MQDSDEKIKKITEDLTSMITSIMDQIKISKSLTAQKYSSNPQDPTTVFLYNSRATPLDIGHSTKIGGIWNLKHEIRPPKF